MKQIEVFHNEGLWQIVLRDCNGEKIVGDRSDKLPAIAFAAGIARTIGAKLFVEQNV